MHLLRYALVMLMFSLAVTPALAQPPSASISGKLTDSKNKPVSYATVTLLRADSSVVNGDLSKDDGSFSISSTGFGTFMLKGSGVGLKSLIVPGVELTANAPTKSVGKVKVAAASNTLKEVSITGERP